MFYAGGLFEVDDSPKAPPLPEGFEELSAEEQETLKRHWWEAVATKYHMELIRKDPRHQTALAHPLAPLFIHPILLAPRTWEHGIYYLKRSLMPIRHNWDILTDTGIPCPLTFSPEEIAHTLEAAKRMKSYDDRVVSLSKELDVDCDRQVNGVENFELVKRKSDGLRDKWDAVAAGGPYPFQDGGYSVV